MAFYECVGKTQKDVDNAYNNGRTQGRNDVTSNPNSYSLYTASQYSTNYTSGYNAGVASITTKEFTWDAKIGVEQTFDTGLNELLALYVYNSAKSGYTYTTHAAWAKILGNLYS